MHLASELQAIEPRVAASPWDGYEHYRGYAVMALPLSSGHLLGLRVFPETDFAPYASVWHRTPEGHWSIHNDGPSLQTTCPRLWGPALQHANLTHIDVSWIGPNTLRIGMERPHLEWTMTMSAPPYLRALNAVSANLPLWTWRYAILRRPREWIAKHILGMGDVNFSFITPARHDAVAVVEQVYFIDSSEVVLEGRDLGEPVGLDDNPTIGDVSLPARPTFVIGEAQARIRDLDEYRRTRERVRATSGM